jgi:hypothetical protein
VARPVNQNNTMRWRQPLTESKPHIFHIAAGAVDQNNGGFGARSAACKAELRHVQPDSVYLDELAGGRVCGLDASDTDYGHRHKHAKHNGKCDYRIRRHATHPLQADDNGARATGFHRLDDPKVQQR